MAETTAYMTTAGTSYYLAESMGNAALASAEPARDISSSNNSYNLLPQDNFYDTLTTNSASFFEDCDEDFSLGVSFESQVLLTVIYSVTILLAIAGNAMVILILGFTARLRTDLNNFLINLAAADLIAAIFCMPFTFVYIMKENWIFGSVACPIVLFIQQVSLIIMFLNNSLEEGFHI
ncbi:neuropeptide Y receptor type 1-like [Lytechinus variegatus]|uniref:neuropeptide Y receptor type 1-like n=1 Tax=Lytechinus variegatus TaxID=7654 RepID=UPI001BB202F9|nr:neuropeptide Y receptor type 1-like [Lytechinus variegatus]